MNNYKITWMQNGYTNTRLITATDAVQAIQNMCINAKEVISLQLLESANIEDNTYKP